MKSKLFIFAVAASLLVSCADDAPIPRSEMIDILHDIVYVESLIVTDNDARMQGDSMYVYQPILEKYGYDNSQFAAALHYYLYDAKELLKITNAVRDRFNEEEREMSRKAEEERTEMSAAKDSASAPSDTVKQKESSAERRERHLRKEDLEKLEMKLK